MKQRKRRLGKQLYKKKRAEKEHKAVMKAYYEWLFSPSRTTRAETTNWECADK